MPLLKMKKDPEFYGREWEKKCGVEGWSVARGGLPKQFANLLVVMSFMEYLVMQRKKMVIHVAGSFTAMDTSQEALTQ